MRAVIAVGCVAGLLAVGGCGGGSQSPPVAVDAAAEAADEKAEREEAEREERRLKDAPKGKRAAEDDD